MKAPQTPSQTVGPYFSMILARSDQDAVMVGDDTPGERVVLTGRILDGEGAPIEDGLVEVWQANSEGRYRHPLDDRTDAGLHDGFLGVGRARTRHEDGRWTVTTVRPGRVPAPDGTMQAPHVNLVVQARGMLDPVWTRLYFDDEAEANATDPVLTSIEGPRRMTLVATHVGGQPPTFELDIHLQGDGETVFLDW